MNSGLVLVTQVGLLALVMLLSFRMLSLVRSDPLTVSLNRTDRSVRPEFRRAPAPGFKMTSTDRAELCAQLHILAGLQKRDCQVNGLELADAPDAVRAYATVWLYGAACAICDQPTRHSEALGGMVAQLASRKIGIRQPEALQAVATLTSSNILLACFRSGLEGAHFWQQHHHVPPCFSLYEAITANAFI